MPADDQEPRILRIRITAREKQALAALLRENTLDLACGGPKHEGASVSLEALVPESAIERLRRYPVEIQILEDASATGRERQKEVGKGNRFEGRKVPRGLGRKIKDGDR